jgi:hypothetical protein
MVFSAAQAVLEMAPNGTTLESIISGAKLDCTERNPSMKKLLAISLLVPLATAAFALDLSARVGANVGAFSSSYRYEEWGWDSYTDLWTTTPFGFSTYFDATYGVAAIGFRANGNTKYEWTRITGPITINDFSEDGNRSGFLSLSLLGRYPFTLGPVTLFPLLGIEYDLNLYYKDENGANLKAGFDAQQKADLNQFWFKFGVGSDISVYKGLYVRPLVLFGFKLLNSAEKTDLQDAQANATVARYTDFVFEGWVQAGWRF